MRSTAWPQSPVNPGFVWGHLSELLLRTCKQTLPEEMLRSVLNGPQRGYPDKEKRPSSARREWNQQTKSIHKPRDQSRQQHLRWTWSDPEVATESSSNTSRLSPPTNCQWTGTQSADWNCEGHTGRFSDPAGEACLLRKEGIANLG